MCKPRLQCPASPVPIKLNNLHHRPREAFSSLLLKKSPQTQCRQTKSGNHHSSQAPPKSPDKQPRKDRYRIRQPVGKQCRLARTLRITASSYMNLGQLGLRNSCSPTCKCRINRIRPDFPYYEVLRPPRDFDFESENSESDNRSQDETSSDQDFIDECF